MIGHQIVALMMEAQTRGCIDLLLKMTALYAQRDAALGRR